MVVYEIELTPQSRRCLMAILRAWMRPDHVEGCVYLCPPSTPTQQVVRAAIRRVHAEDEVAVVELRRGAS